MPIDWNQVRYRGDAEDVKQLYETYRVGDYLETYEESSRHRDHGAREKLLKQGIRLSKRLSPRIYRIFNEVCSALELEAEAEVFCLPDSEINAFAVLDMQKAGTYSLIGVTSGALEKLDDAELRSILGHELGHFLFGNNRLNALITTDKDNPSATVLPSFGESLFLRWRKKAEISADRVGLLASKNLYASTRALMKATFGLTERNLNLDIDALLSQIDEISGHPELIEEAFATHPLLPIRLKALELFAKSRKAKESGFIAEEEDLSDSELEDRIDALIHLTRRHPFKPLDEAVMKVIAMGGALTLSADREITDDEVKVLIQILHHYFTDNPEEVIRTDRDEVKRELQRAIKTVNEEGDDGTKEFILSRLADVALADGALMDTEGAVILQVAEWLNLPSRRAYAVIVGAAQAVGFHTDVKLNRMAEELRCSLAIGMGIKD